MQIEWPEEIERWEHTPIHLGYKEGWNAAIDACKEAVKKAQVGMALAPCFCGNENLLIACPFCKQSPLGIKEWNKCYPFSRPPGPRVPSKSEDNK